MSVFDIFHFLLLNNWAKMAAGAVSSRSCFVCQCVLSWLSVAVVCVLFVLTTAVSRTNFWQINI